MKNASKLFLGLTVFTVLSFILCGFSLIRCFVIGFPEDSLGTHILEVSYLFIHLIAVAIIFYLAFRAMKFGSFFAINVMTTPDGNKNTTKQIIFFVLSGVFLLLGIYSTLIVCGISLPLDTTLGFVIWHDLMNASYLICAIFLTLALYPIFGPLLKMGD